MDVCDMEALEWVTLTELESGYTREVKTYMG